jgi:hypothetical protein
MAKKLEKPTEIESAGNKPKMIEEFLGLVNTDTSSLDVAKMTIPSGWIEPGNRLDFDEYTIILKGTRVVDS